jgi:hypothetical protein
MMRRLFLVFVMGMILVTAATTSTPFPVLLGMGFLILFALSVATRSEQQG